MSSDTYTIQIAKLDGATVELLCTTSTAGGYSDYAVTRSFVLMALEDGMPYARTTPLQRRLVELGGGDMPRIWDASFHREHVDEFIASTELVERSGIIGDENAWRERFDLDDETAERDYPLHRFVVRARMTDPKWLEGLKVGARYGTTAFDAWWDDPKRPSKAQLAAVERKASRWRPPGAKPAAATKTKTETKKMPKKTAAKKTTTRAAAPKKTTKRSATKTAAAKKTTKTAPAKKAAKKTAAKKTTAKKTAAKKTAAKKTAAKKTTARAAAPKKTTKRSAAKKAPAKKTAAKKTAAKKTTRAAAPKKTTKRIA